LVNLVLVDLACGAVPGGPVDDAQLHRGIAGLGKHYPCKLFRAHLKPRLMDPELGPVRVERWGREP
jgi:hypothetical protein